MKNGKKTLLKELGIQGKRELKTKAKVKMYVFGISFLTSLLSIIFGFYLYLLEGNILLTIVATILLYIPFSEIAIQFINYILSKIVKPKLIPKMDFSKSLPKEYSTFVVVPTIINSREKVQELVKKLEIYYLANKSENLYFALLGDCTSSKKEIEKEDDEIIKTGLEEVEKLNKKYSLKGLSKFHFLYRKRTWSAGEECYLGWERKRGLLCQFNEFLVDDNNKFLVNTIHDFYTKNQTPKTTIKYVITLDSDTNLILGSALELIGSMAHILNKPILNEAGDCVIKGHGIIQPRVGINLEASRKSIFTKLYSGFGGIDLYTNAISDVYQDNFDEGIFTGKGIYELEIFHKILCNEIAENKVLSHDLLEGSYLRCGLASDILVLDDYPSKFNTYSLRMERWTRGDFQIASWIKNRIKIKSNIKKNNPLRNSFKI